MSERKARVLIVENASQWLKCLCAILEGLGCELWTASTFEQGIEALEQGPYDLAIVDVRLIETKQDDISGLQIIKEAWNRRSIEQFIVLSGYPVESQVRAELSEIPYQIFDKADVTNKQLKDAVQSLVGEAKSDEPRRST